MTIEISPIDTLRETIPDFAKDIRINLSSVLTPEGAPDLSPKDDKLQKLQQLLDQQQNQNSQSQSQDQQPPDQQKSQSDQKNQQQQQQQQPQPSKSDQEKQKEQEQQAQKAAEQKKDQDQPDKSEAQKAAEAAAKQGSETNDLADAKGNHPMTPQEAERLLNARKGSEQYLAQKPNAKPPNSRHPVKDW